MNKHKPIQPHEPVDVTRPGDVLTSFLADQNISLKPNELLRIHELLDRNPTPVELHIFNVMWSEHCSYKSSKAVLKTLPTTGPHVVLGPGEDAGIIRFFEKDGVSWCLVLAHESHNHPSQVLPVEGAATGVGGIVRDVYCMGADVIGVLDPLRFGDPFGPNARRVRDIVRGVVDGIAQYGNALGVPNWGGETYFDSSFDDNCLVNVVAMGLVREDGIIRSRAPEAARKNPHDIILFGKPTDASGFGGAAFASERLSGDAAEERQEAVQVPDPFLKRVLAEATKVVLADAKARGIEIGFKDLGAGGIACAVSEMAHAGGVGADLHLDLVHRSSHDLPLAVVSCSETQERFAMFVPPQFTPRVLEVYNEVFELPHIYMGAGARVIGRTNDDLHFRLKFDGQLVCDAHVDAITTGIEYERESAAAARETATSAESAGAKPDIEEALMSLLSSVNIADKSILYRHYDTEVQGKAVLRPGEADAAVALVAARERVAVATGIGSNSMVGQIDPYIGGMWSVIEAARNVACVGALPLAVTDCLNFGDPEQPEVFWQFSEAVRGIGDACRGLKLQGETVAGVPVVSGNVSFYNQSGSGRPIAPTPIVACAGRIDDVSAARGLGFERAGATVALIGDLHGALGGSEFARLFLADATLEVPRPDVARESALINTLVDGFAGRMLRSAHDVGHGGILVTIAEMVLASGNNRIGCDVELPDALATSWSRVFGEFAGVVVEVNADSWDAFEKLCARYDARLTPLGTTAAGGGLSIKTPFGDVAAAYDDLDRAHRARGRCNSLFD